MIISTFPCRSETFISNQITGLIDRGHEVDIYSLDRGADTGGEFTSLEGHDVKGRIFYFTQSALKIPEKKLVRLVRALGLLYEAGPRGAWNLLRSLNLVRYGKVAATLSLLYQGAVLLRNGPYDIVHCHFGQNGKLGATLKDVGVIGGKVITTFYGHDISKYIKRNGFEIYDLLFAQGDLFVGISGDMRDQLSRLGCRREKIVVHRLGVDLSRFIFSPRRPKEGSKVRILMVGRFVEKKGLEYGIRAVAQAAKDFPEITLKIVGDGELRDEITQLINRLNMSKHIQLLGWRTPEEVSKLMGEADIFLAPSVTSKDGDQEGTPTVIIEAQARGLPVLSTRHSGIPEMVQDGISGFLIPERDSEALAEKLKLLCQHPEMRGEMGKAGRDWVERHHDINKLNDQLVRLYERVVCENFRASVQPQPETTAKASTSY